MHAPIEEACIIISKYFEITYSNTSSAPRTLFGKIRL